MHEKILSLKRSDDEATISQNKDFKLYISRVSFDPERWFAARCVFGDRKSKESCVNLFIKVIIYSSACVHHTGFVLECSNFVGVCDKKPMMLKRGRVHVCALLASASVAKTKTCYLTTILIGV